MVTWKLKIFCGCALNLLVYIPKILTVVIRSFVLFSMLLLQCWKVGWSFYVLNSTWSKYWIAPFLVLLGIGWKGCFQYVGSTASILNTKYIFLLINGFLYLILVRSKSLNPTWYPHEETKVVGKRCQGNSESDLITSFSDLVS